MPQAQTYNQKNTAILHNNEDGGIAIICASPDKKLQQSNKETSWKSERSEKANSSPTCCRQRHECPPGYTVFECRVDGNQPIAQVVQVPSDTTDKIIQNKTCMLLETKQSESGPSSRVVAYPAGAPSCRIRRTIEPMSFALEARDCPAGAVARAEKVAEHVDDGSAMCSTQPVTILETTKGPTCRNGPTSQIVYGSVSQENEKSSGVYETPGFHIQCTTTRDGPIARVTQVPQELSNSRDPGTTYEAFVNHDGSSPTAVVTQCNKKEDIVQSPCEFLETRVDALGPQARAFTSQEGPPNFRHFTHLDVRPQKNGPFARISQYLGKPDGNISNLRPKQVCAPCYTARKAISPQRPVKFARTCNQLSNQAGLKFKPIMGKRNGLSPISSEHKPRTFERLKNTRIRGVQRSEVPKYCSPQCCRPVSSPDAAFTVCGVKPGSSVKRSKSAFPKAVNCGCPVQHVCGQGMDLPFSEMRPLPGGTVVPSRPPLSLPEISPVPFGVNNFRNHKPSGSKPKSSGSRKPISASPSIPSKPVKVILKPKKSDKLAVPKKKTKNKKTGSSGKYRISMEATDQGKDERVTPDPVVKYVDCPAFASKGIQSVNVCENQSVVTCPALESKGSQSVRICEKSSGVEYSDFKSDGIQTARFHEKPSCVECSTVQPEKRLSVRVCKKPSFVECPAFEADKRQLARVCENRSVVTCPALESKGSQSVRICEKSSGVDCPDFKSDGIQPGRLHEKPSCVECPLFQSGKRRFVRVSEKPYFVEGPAFEAEKRELVRNYENPSFIECPAFEAEKRQTIHVCEKSTRVKRPRLKSKGNQSVHVCNNQLYVQCPAFESRENQLDLVPEEPSYMSHLQRIKSISRSDESDFVKCPGFTSRKSSETSSVYVPRDEVLMSKYSKYFRPKTLTTEADFCAKRNRLQDECCLHIPQTVLRMSYEQRRNRHARTLLSNGSLRRKINDEDADIGMTYCQPSSKSRKQDGHKKPEGPTGSLKDKKKDVEIVKSVKPTPQNSPKARKLGLKKVKSRELRAGVVYYDCDCYHRNGLEHDCPRGGCEGQKSCLNKPWPKCTLSSYFKKKWSLYNEVLDLTPPTSFCGPRDALYQAKMKEENYSKHQKKDNKLEKPEENPPKIEEKSTKPTDKKAHKYKTEKSQIKDECHQVHENMVQQYAIIPVIPDQHY